MWLVKAEFYKKQQIFKVNSGETIMDNYSNLMINNSVPIFNISNPNEPITIFHLAKLIAENFNVPVKKGPMNVNVYSAPKIVKVHPTRFLKIFKDFEFTKLSAGLKIVCSSAKKNFSE